MPRNRLAAVAFGLWLALAGAGESATLRVFAAASLTDAFREIGAAYEKAHPGDVVELSFAGSQVLRTQIEQGARADVFASADLEHAEALRRSGLLPSFQVFARNELVVVVPANGARVGRLVDLARPRLKLVVAGPTVPVGRYSTQVLAKLSAAGLYGDDFQARVTANVVSQETNVRVVLSKVALGEADAGFVYVTDAATSAEVRTIEIPDRYNVVAQYPIGVLAQSAAAEAARAFVDLVASGEGTAILRRFGFETLP